VGRWRERLLATGPRGQAHEGGVGVKDVEAGQVFQEATKLNHNKQKNIIDTASQETQKH
jgi:hypothetical protein